MTLGEKIQDLRRRNAMSQDVLAEKLEVSRQAVSKWERDEAMPETEKLVRIAQLFGVSTDYLLLDKEEPRTYQQPQHQSYQPRQNTGAGRAEQFIRRHGYKAGYGMIVVGAILCVMALLILNLLPKFGSGVFDTAGSFGHSWGSGVIIEGEVDQEILNDIYDSLGEESGFFDPFDQQLEQMEQGWTRSTSIIATLIGTPILLMGVALLGGGVFIVIRGKKLAQEEMR